ncbi:replication factor C large subunit [Candidatus Daviesbacteria bacterium]|nr:replication factor C large subunit [Candidatus Daviesbacteria bacterium]
MTLQIKKDQQWTEKYRPISFTGVKGQTLATQKVKQFIESKLSRSSLVRNTKKALILHGPPGTGKTTLAHVAAKENNAEVFELNASDLRDKKRLQEILRPAMEQKSLAKENKIILVDEVDGISKVDYGGLSELLILVEASAYPVIITANDIWDKKFNSLRSKSELVQLKEIDYKTTIDVLIQILRKENLFIPHDIIAKIALNSKGDLRAAINDLQTTSKLEDPSTAVLDDRNKEVDIFNALRLVFKGKPTVDTTKIFDSVNMSIDEIILWVEENIPTEYSGEELAKAYDRLSRVDVFKGRIYKQQYWRFLVYENLLLSYGISSAKKEAKTGFTSYKKPERILKIWLHNQRTVNKKSIAQKYAKHVHVGEKRALQEFPILKNIIKSNIKIQKELRLTPDEVDYLENGK